MPGRRSISVEPEELSTASPRRSTRIRTAVHVDSPAPKKETGADKPATAGRRTRRSQSTQEKSLSDIQNDLKTRDESPLSLKNKVLDSDKPATPTRRLRRSSSLQSDISEDVESKTIRRTRRSAAAKDIPALVEEEKENEEEEENTEEKVGPGRPKRRVTRSMSRSPVDTQTSKPAASAPVTRKYRLSLNKEPQEVAKSNVLDIINETEDESDKNEKASAKSPSKSPETEKITAKSPSKSPDTKKDLLNNNSKKVATVVLKQLDTSDLENNQEKTEVEDNLHLPEVPKSSDEEKENQSDLKVHDTSQKEQTAKEKITAEENLSDDEFVLFLEETADDEKNMKSPKTSPKKQKKPSETNELMDSKTREETVLETSRKEKVHSDEQIQEIINKTIDNMEDPNKTKELNLTSQDKENDDPDSNISLVCEQVIEIKEEIEEDETNISLVGSIASSPKSSNSPPSKPTTEHSNNKEEEHGQNLSLVNDDGRTYSPIIGIAENITVIVDHNDSIVNSSSPEKSLKSLNTSVKDAESSELNMSKKSVNNTPVKDKETMKTPSSRRKSKIANDEENTDVEMLDSPIINDRNISVEKTSPRREWKKMYEELTEESDNVTESPNLNVSIQSTERTSPRRKSKKSEEETNENSSKTTESPKQDSNNKSVKETSTRKSKKFSEDNDDSTEASESTKLDVSKKSPEKTPRRKSIRLNDEDEETIEKSSETIESPKLDVIQKPDEKSSPRKSKKKSEADDDSTEASESPKLDVSEKSSERTSRRKSKRLIDGGEETVEKSSKTIESPKLDMIEKTSNRKSKNFEDEDSTEAFESPKLDVSEKSVERTTRRKSKRLNDGGEESFEKSSETIESPNLDVIEKTSNRKSKNFEDEDSTEAFESPKLDVSQKSVEKTPRRKSKRLNDGGEETFEKSSEIIESPNLDVIEKTSNRKSKNFEDEDSTEAFESPKLDVSKKSVEKTPRRKSKKINDEDEKTFEKSSETTESPKLDVNKKSAEKTSPRKSKKFSEDDDDSTETTESPKLDVSRMSVERTPRRKSKKMFDEDEETIEKSSETTESPKPNVNGKSTEKNSDRKSKYFEEDEDSVDSPREIIEDSTEINNASAEQENKDSTPAKSVDSKNEAKKDRNKMLDDYLASYTAEKKRKREFDETFGSVTVPEEKKKRKNVRDIDFSHSEDDDSDNENRHEFLDDMAFEGSEDSPSVDSNEIIDDGESIGSTDSEIDSDEDYEHGSFVVDDDVGNELLSGDDELLEDSIVSENKNRRRIITISDSSDEDIDDLSMKPFGGMSPAMSVNQTISVDSDVELVQKKNEELSKQIEEGSRMIDDQSIIMLDDSVVEFDKSIKDTKEQISKEKDTEPAEELNGSVAIVEGIETSLLDETIEPEKENIIGKQSVLNETIELEKDDIVEIQSEDLETADKEMTLTDAIEENEIETNLNVSKITENEDLNTEKETTDSIIKDTENEKSLIEEQFEISENEECLNESNKEETKEDSIAEEQESEVNDSNQKIVLNDSTTDENNEKYQDLLDKYFKQFEEEGSNKRTRRETLGELPAKQQKSKKRERRQSLGSQNPVEEARQRFDRYCQELKDKQERKRKFSGSKENTEDEQSDVINIETKLKRKSLTKLHEIRENINAILEEVSTAEDKKETITKSKRKSLSKLNESIELLTEVQEQNKTASERTQVKITITKPTPKRRKSLSLTENIEVQEPEEIAEKTPKNKSKRKSLVSYEINTSGVYEVSPLKLDDAALTDKNEFLEEATEMLKDFSNCLKEETEIRDTPKTDKVKVASTAEESQVTKISKKKNKKKKSSVQQFEDLAKVNIFQSPLKKKLKTVEQFDNLSEVNIFHTPEKTSTLSEKQKVPKSILKSVETTTEEKTKILKTEKAGSAQKKKNRKLSESESLETIPKIEKSPVLLKPGTTKIQKKKKQKVFKNLETVSVQQEKSPVQVVECFKLSPIKAKKSLQSKPLMTDVGKVQKKKNQTATEPKKLDIISVKQVKSPIQEKSSLIKAEVSKIQKKKAKNLDIVPVKQEKSPVQISEMKKRKKKKKSISSDSSDVYTDSSEVKRQKISSETDSSLENKSPSAKKTKKRKQIKSTPSEPSILKVKHENNIDIKPLQSFKTRSKGAASKFTVKKEKIQPSLSEYTFAAKYFPTKTNKYKNLITPSSSGWTDPTVTVMNISHASRGIKKQKLKHRVLKASLAGNVNKFNVEELLSENLVKSVNTGNTFKKKSFKN